MAISLYAQSDQIDSLINKEYPSLDVLYKHLHENPELSHQEVKTSARIAEELRKVGYQVTEGFGEYPKDSGKISYGIVGVMKNGAGPYNSGANGSGCAPPGRKNRCSIFE